MMMMMMMMIMVLVMMMMMMIVMMTMISKEVGGPRVTKGTDYNSRHSVWDFW
jgi:hypothetical protein